MKNLFILPTDKETRLFTSDSELILAGYPATTFKTGKNIYITSGEEIKYGNWKLKCKNVNDLNFKLGELQEKDYSYFKIKCISLALLNPEDKKIILTTDSQLIADGVQAIDDEFLEWFVKNPSCEWVEVEKVLVMNDRFKLGYKIIIPKEEPKQETLEEAAKTHAFNSYEKEDRNEAEKSFIAGAKWQQERMYSEDFYSDLSDKFYESKLLHDYKDGKIDYRFIRNWFIKQFKNK